MSLSGIETSEGAQEMTMRSGAGADVLLRVLGATLRLSEARRDAVTPANGPPRASGKRSPIVAERPFMGRFARNRRRSSRAPGAEAHQVDDAGDRRALPRRHHRHDVGLPRRHVHLDQALAKQEERGDEREGVDERHRDE